MGNKTQTAVEWLLEVLNDQQLLKNYPIEIIDRAYEMEKQQIQEAFENGVDDEYEWHINNQPRTNSEQYYNETFNQ
jgi:hypothetical protein